MRKPKTKEKSKNLHLGFYFFVFVAFIIVISISFKIFDTFKRSKFDGGNLFTVAVLSSHNSQLISVSPKDGRLKKLTIVGAENEETLRQNGIPFDSIATSGKSLPQDTKSYFKDILLRKDGIKSNLTIVDLIKLTFYSQKVGGDNVDEESVSLSDESNFSKITSEWFIDPQIAKENVNIEITNTTSTPGLGNKLAKVITNMGGTVVLVNNSQNEEKKSKIYYKEDSYTVKKLSTSFGIPAEKKEVNALSDIVIQIGKDKENF